MPSCLLRTATCLLGLLACLATRAGATNLPAHLWFSFSNTDPLQSAECGGSSSSPHRPDLNLSQGSSKTLYLWAQPEVSQGQVLTLQNISLNVRHDPGVSIDEFDFVRTDRFTEIVDTTLNDHLTLQNGPSPTDLITYPIERNGKLERVAAYNVVPSLTAGIDGTTSNGVLVPPGPGGRQAWLIATMEVGAVASSGTANISLEVGHASITHSNPGVPFNPTAPPLITTVRFGDANDTPYNSASQRQMSISGDSPDVIVNLGSLLPGDINGDGVVDLLDLDLLGRGFGQTGATRCDGDLNGDGTVDLLDLDILGSNFGQTGGSLSVPEPTAWLTAMGVIGLLALCRCGSRGGAAALLLVALAIGHEAKAVQLDADWVAGPGLWTDSGNWSTANFPDNGVDTYAVTIDAPSSLVILNTIVLVDSLNLSDPASFLSVNNELGVVGAVQIDSGVVVLNSTISAASVQNVCGIVLGDGLVFPSGTFVNEASVRPGNTIGSLTVEGDYTQTSTGVLEIEATGTSAVSEHDLLDITGTASLGGRLDLPITATGGVFPLAGQSITVLQAGTRSGEFGSYRFTGLPPTVAQQINYSAFGVGIDFVATTSTALNSPGPVGGSFSWDQMGTWTNGVPDSTSIVNIANSTPGQSDTVTVSGSGNAAHRINLGALGDATLAITDASLSVSTRTDIGLNATVALSGDSQLTSETVYVSGTGTLQGSGDVIADVVVGVGAGQAVFDPSGLLNIEGDYTQNGTGLFATDFTAAPGNLANDLVTVTGDLDLSGALQIDVSSLLNGEFSLGDTFEIIRYDGALSGAFETIDIVGRNDLFFEIAYGQPSPNGDSFLVTGTVKCSTQNATGDAHGDGVIDAFDLAAFAAGLVDNQITRFVQSGTAFSGSWPAIFDFDQTTAGSNGVVDFYDVPHFASCYAISNGISTAQAYAELAAAIELARRPIPEPASVLLVGIVLGAACVMRRHG